MNINLMMHLQFHGSDAPHEASLSHELLGGAAAFEVSSVSLPRTVLIVF